MIPSDEEVADFHRRGWFVSPPIVPDAVLDRVSAAAERYWLGDVADGPEVPATCLPVVPPPPGLRKNDYAALRRPELMELVRLPVLGAIAARLMGAEDVGVRLWHDQLLYKPPSSEGPGAGAPANVGWHTDRSYWRACSADNMVTAWVPFHDVTVEHGALTMLDGSNHWEDEGRDDRLFFRQDLDAAEHELSEAGRKLVKVPIELKRGQVSFHHCRTFHGSGPNRTGEPRRSLAIHMQPGDNRFSGLRDASGQPWHHANHDVCRWVDGKPDYTDPHYFPTLLTPTSAISTGTVPVEMAQEGAL